MSLKPLRLLHETLRYSAERVPDKIAIISGQDRISYAQLWQYSVRLTHALKQIGVNRNDRVVIFLDNTWHDAVALYSTLLADAVFVIVNPTTKADKLAYILNNCTATVLIAKSDLQRFFLPAAAAVPSLKSILVVGQLPDDADCRLHDFSHALMRSTTDDINARNITLDLCSLIYTSGSTGEPKGVMHTHQSMLFALQSLVEYLRLEESDQLLCILPLAFDYGLYQLLMAIHIGATLVLERSFTYPAQVFKVMEADGITVFPGVPTVFAMLLAAHERQPLCFPKVRCVTNTAAALPASFNTRLQEVFPQAVIYRMYGLTECKRVSYLPPDQIEQKPESVGIAIPGTEVMVLDDAGQPIKPGEVGTLYVRGPHVMLGYWNQPEQTGHMLKPGSLPGERLLCTHDLFTVDQDGYLYFIGRTDDIIKTRGEKVSPLEIEKVLYGVAEIREAAVLGVPDPVLGQAVHAFISLTEGNALNERQIKKLCSDRLEAFMVPKHLTILPELPKSSNGKIDKKALVAILSTATAT